MDEPAVAAVDLGQVALALAEAQGTEAVLDVVARVALPLAGADGLLLSLVEGRDLVLRRHSGYDEQVLQLLQSVPLTTTTPIAVAARGGTAVFLERLEDYLVSFPESATLARLSGKSAWAFLPLVASRRTTGTLLLSYDVARVFTGADRTRLLALAGLCSQALERARLLDDAQEVSAALQRALLPELLPALPSVSFAARYRPALQPEQVVGGDWYDAQVGEDGTVSVSIGDVVGHDIHAAAVMGEVRHTVRAFASEGHGRTGSSPGSTGCSPGTGQARASTVVWRPPCTSTSTPSPEPVRRCAQATRRRSCCAPGPRRGCWRSPRACRWVSRPTR